MTANPYEAPEADGHSGTSRKRSRRAIQFGLIGCGFFGGSNLGESIAGNVGSSVGLIVGSLLMAILTSYVLYS